MKDRAYIQNSWSMEWRYILDGKDFSSPNAIHYLRECGYEAIDALTFIKSLREEAKANV